MPDEELDKLITDAANQHYPSYNDKDWDKMLHLLNRYMPEKKDRKRPLLFWLLPLLLTGVLLLGVLQPWKTNTNVADVNVVPEKNTQAQIQDAKTNGNLTTDIKSINKSLAVESNRTKVASESQIQSNNKQPGITVKNYNYLTAVNETLYQNTKNHIKQKSKTVINIKKPSAYSDDEPADNNDAKKEPLTQPASVTKAIMEDAVVQSNLDIDADNNKKTSSVINTKDSIEENKPNVKTEDTVSAVKNNTAEKKAEQKKKTFASKFAITASAGADISFVGLNNPGKTNIMYGAGLSYYAGKRMRISTGFYIAGKKYAAAPQQYKFPAGTSYPYLDKVVANCKVYEIPLNVYYNFKQYKNQNWFVGAGLSSYLMKKEDYEYQYKYPTGQMHSYYKNYSNQYKHYFSVLTLSGGWQYNINKRISFITEPYIKIPFAGVGAGKVKLNSTGVLLTIAVKPF
jgi:hypothetical protein